MSENIRKIYAVSDVAQLTGIDPPTIIMFIQREWICPQSEDILDDEDLARIQLIHELRDVFNATDESIPVILHLMDQLYYLRRRIRQHPSA